MGTWLNGDGLYVKFGTDEGHSITDAGQFRTADRDQVLELDINLVDLTETEAIQNDVARIPSGSLIKGFELEVAEAAATGVGIDIGTIAASRNASDSAYTADPDGICVAVVTAELTLGAVYKVWGAATNELPAFGSTGAWGNDIATIAPTDLLITASRTTSTAFTTGKVRLRVIYTPNVAASNEFALGLS